MKRKLPPLTLREAIRIAGGSPLCAIDDGEARLERQTIEGLSCKSLSDYFHDSYGSDAKEYREFYCLFAWLKADCAASYLTFPLDVKKAEAPDFLISFEGSNSVLAVEQVDACSPVSRKVHAAVRRDGHPRLIPSPGDDGVLASDGRGWRGDEPQRFFASELRTAVRRKIGSCWRNAPEGAQRVLLVGDAITPGLWIDKETATAIGKRVLDEIRSAVPVAMSVFLVRDEQITFSIS